MASEPVIDQFGSEATTREEDGSEQAEDTLKEPGEQDLCLESIQLCSTSGPHPTSVRPLFVAY